MEHTFDELPVVTREGTYLGLVAMKSLRLVPREQWPTMQVLEIMDRQARTVCAHHSMRVVEQELAQSAHDYLPVVEPETDRLIGMLSASDVLRARTRFNEAEETKRGFEFKAGV